MNLKICYILPRLLSGKNGIIVGGAVNNCISLALELKRQGVQIELLASVPEECSKYLSCHPVQDIVKSRPSSGIGLIGKGVSSIQSLRRSLKEQMRQAKYNIVHSHSGTYPYAFATLTANRKACVRLHSLYCPLGAKGGVYGRWWEKPLLAKLIFSRLDRVIAVTDNVHQSISKTGVPSGKIELIPMCVDTRRFSPKPQKEKCKYFPDKYKGARILFIGNASKEKGLVELLQAVQILTRKGISIFLVATVENQSSISEYSTGYDNAKQFVSQMGLDKQVRFLDLVDKIENLYAETDIVVIPWKTSRGPSDYPMVAIEAMAMGKCVVSTPVGGCPELLLGGKAGILTEGFSAESIASTLEFAIKHPEICRLRGEVGVETVKNFSVEKSAKHMINLYECLLKEKA